MGRGISGMASKQEKRVECPSCHTTNGTGARRCAHCGTPLATSRHHWESRESTDELHEDAQITPVERYTLASSKVDAKRSEALRPGMVLADRYEIEAEIAEGGMGKLYKAWDRAVEEVVGLKVIRPDLKERKDLLVRFRNEIKLARRLTHPNIGRIHDIASADGFDFITMSYIEGEDLSECLARRKRFPIVEGIRIARQICQALIAAHEAGVVHRDLKPPNIMIDREGRAYILDFGLARSMHGNDLAITTEGIVVGTPAYMSPEQVEGEALDGRSDLYSLGVILYEIFTGHLPFKGSSALATAFKHVHSLPLPPRKLNPEIPPELERIILRCMEKDRKDRYADARMLLYDLEHLGSSRKWPRLLRGKRRKAVAGATGALLLLTFLFLVRLYLSGVEWRPGWLFFPGWLPKDHRVIAVLDFENLTHDLSYEWLSRGIADTVSTRLSDLPRVRMVARERVLGLTRRFSGEGDSRVIDRIVMAVRRKRLGIDWVVTGNFQTFGRNVRVTAQLIDAGNGRVIGDAVVDGPVEAIFRLEDEIAEAIGRDIDRAFSSKPLRASPRRQAGEG